MYAEYLESIPDDFMEEWIMMICPKGKRCMVTSGNGETVARSRGGHVIGRFQSILPNGSK
jgi:snurportin-1